MPPLTSALIRSAAPVLLLALAVTSSAPTCHRLSFLPGHLKKLRESPGPPTNSYYLTPRLDCLMRFDRPLFFLAINASRTCAWLSGDCASGGGCAKYGAIFRESLCASVCGPFRFLLIHCGCRTVIPHQHFRVLKQRFQPSLFTKFLTLNRVTVERDAGFPVDRDLAQKNPRVILRMSLFLDLDDFVGWHARRESG